VFRYEALAGGARLRLRVVVEPDAFYERFFAALLERGAGGGEAQIRRALAAARRSPFTVYEHETPLRGARPAPGHRRDPIAGLATDGNGYRCLPDENL
jgi:hypothetical protein